MPTYASSIYGTIPVPVSSCGHRVANTYSFLDRAQDEGILSLNSSLTSQDRRCPECRSRQVRPSQQRRRLYDWPYRILGRKPYRCENCYVRFFQSDGNLPASLLSWWSFGAVWERSSVLIS